MDFDLGGGKVLRLRLLEASEDRKRRHLYRRARADLVSVQEARQARYDKARELLERRRLMWLEGVDDLTAIEKEIRSYGMQFEDEPDSNGETSFWMVR